MLSKKQNTFSKPAKLYLDNPNLSHILCQRSDIGTIREQFFVNALEVDNTMNYSKVGDFLVNEAYIFEIGGAKKSFNQIKDIQKSFVASDGIEIGSGSKIPLWLFGFLY
jgi:predicted AAA+ superfamily ATPase